MTDLDALLRDRDSLETEVADYRRLKAALAAFIQDAANDRDARIALAAHIGLPAPAPERTF
ncbi:hypothetical protein [Streptomyces nigrescens]